MGLNTRVSGKKISNMVKDSRLGLMVPNTTGSTSKERSMAKACSPGLTARLMMDILLRTISKARVAIIGRTEDNTKVIG